MTPLTIKGLTLGQGQSKIAVPITGTTANEVTRQGQIARANQPDLVEWRLDFLAEDLSATTVQAISLNLSQELTGIPIIATFRTQAEGGQRAISDNDYGQLLKALADSQVDLIDIEINREAAIVTAAITECQANGKAVIGSYHNFSETPSDQALHEQFAKMADLNVDLAKIAVMPKTAADVLRLMTASQTASTELDQPVVTMAMGGLGQLSRISGELTGSAISFASLDVQSASAPGQFTVQELTNIFQIIGGNHHESH